MGSLDTSGGAATEGNVNAGKDFTGRDAHRNDPRQTVNVSGGNDWVVAQIIDHGQQIRDLTYRLDNIPNDFRRLQDEVKKLQAVEIIVRQNEVVVKPVATSAISIRTLMITLVIALTMIIALVAFLIYWQVSRG